MGILNITPDSFSDGGFYNSTELAVKRASQLILDGADILDIGGESTRPGASQISIKEELNRIIPVIKEIRKRYKDILISVDTYKSEVAKQSIASGASIINDISGLVLDKKMAGVAASLDVPVVLMHLKGTPQNMQVNPTYKNLISEIKDFLIKQANYAKKEGVKPKNIIIDPGIGFGKTVKNNFEILARLKEFANTGYPVLVGPSRKSFIGKTLNLPVDKRLEGTAASIAISIINGAKIVRVHDVSEMKKVCKIVDKTLEMK
jgi:dihydropteroate synthase